MPINSVRITRDSYCASDDVDAPHEQTISILSGATLEDVVQAVHRKCQTLMRPDSSQTWVITSKHPIAVVNSKWRKPRMLLRTVRRMEDSLMITGNTAYLHYCLIQNTDPETIYSVMDRLRYPYLRSSNPS